VSPELIRFAPGMPPTTRWQQSIDAALTDVFALQGDIATKVVSAIGVVLGDSARRELNLKPTESLAAYDEYPKGEAASQAMRADQAGLRRAIGFFERAVALDSSFAQAWSQLSRARTSLYSNGVPDPVLGQRARFAAARAQALRPADPLVYLALGDLYGSVNPIDNQRAVAAYERGLDLAPDDVDLLSALATPRPVWGGGTARRRASHARHGWIRARPAWRAGWPRCTSSSGTTPRRIRRPIGRWRSRRPARRWSRSRSWLPSAGATSTVPAR